MADVDERFSLTMSNGVCLSDAPLLGFAWLRRQHLPRVLLLLMPAAAPAVVHELEMEMVEAGAESGARL